MTMSTRFDVYNFDPENPTFVSRIAESRPCNSFEKFTIYIPAALRLFGRKIMIQNSESVPTLEYFETLFFSKAYPTDHELIIFEKYQWKNQTKYKPFPIGQAATVDAKKAYILDLGNTPISGRISMSPLSNDGVDYQQLGSYYMSAADEMGM